MSDVPDKDATPLATLVRAGDTQTEAQEIAEGIYLSADVSNSYLVSTGGGASPPNGRIFANRRAVSSSTPSERALMRGHTTGMSARPPPPVDAGQSSSRRTATT